MKKKIVIATADNLERLSELPRGTVIRAYKIVRRGGIPPLFSETRPRLRYLVGKTVVEKNFNGDPRKGCGAGLNVGTLNWCREVCYVDACGFYPGDRLITVEFSSSDIVCVPYKNNGKFRVKRLKVVKSVRVSWRKR